MQSYCLFVHNNYGASPFTEELINSIYDALDGKGILDLALSGNYEIDWQGEPGEELAFPTNGFCMWLNAHNDMMELSRLFPECNFCLKSVGEWLDDETVAYYRNGKFESKDVMQEFYSDLW